MFNVKEYFKLSIIYTLIAAFPPVLQILIQPIIEGKDRLDAIDFSHLALTELFSSFVFVFTLYGMGAVVNRYYYDFMQDKKGYNKLISTILSSILFRGFIILGIALIFENYIGNFFYQKELQDFSNYGYAAIVIGINRSINITAATLYRNEKKVFRFVILNIALGIFRSAFQVIGVLYYDLSFVGYVTGTCIGSSITSFIVIIYIYKHAGIKYNMEIAKEINKYARPLFQYNIIYWGLSFADRLFLEDSPKELGIYDTAMKFAFGIQMILQGLQGASQPEIFRFMKDGIQKNQESIRRAANILMAQTKLLVAVAIIPTMLYITYLFESDITIAAGFISIVFIRFLLRTQLNIFSLPIYYIKKTKIFLHVNLIALVVNLLLNYFLIPLYGIYGAIIASIIPMFIQTIIIYYYQNKLVKIEWNLLKILYFPIVIVLCTMFLELIKCIYQVDAFVMAIVVSFVIFLGLFILYKKEINKYARIFKVKFLKI